MKSIYVITMQTGTIVSRIIKNMTRHPYSHVVLSLDDSYTKLYSFGRRTLHNVFNAGLVTYGIESDFFKTFFKTECVIYEIQITEKKYKRLEKILRKYEKNMYSYHYDIKGLLVRIFYSKPRPRENYYVCSQFVADVLLQAKIYNFKKPSSRVRPDDFAHMNIAQKIYEGRFSNARE